MKGIEAVECERCVRTREGSRKPSLPQELTSPIRNFVVGTFAIVDIDGVNTRGVEYQETGWARGWAWASPAAVAELDA